MTFTSHARVDTDRPARYLKQLCSHFDRKANSTFDEEKGRTDFEFGVCEFLVEQGALVLDLTAGDLDQLDKLEFVVGDHLERFGKKDGLAVNWKRD
ncbi:DUF2218 domain-containing protein [Natronoglycomyces albus]|uniref:DUF2218 domain-containing protein n=1 Tax=Natronoglycomyces albus TaxID=2811108 RepID=A0A895XLZ4_9ACTN|nr:DUF2218 domain-containing protein [Natronoglycomyces albus]QSB03985.1 DUF2218 domain-containing protein [Natronoglycomyces albus]